MVPWLDAARNYKSREYLWGQILSSTEFMEPPSLPPAPSPLV